ncbi:MAG: tetratricopeptide repeat protein [Flavicella sp.]
MRKFAIIIACLFFSFSVSAQDAGNQEAMIKYNLFKGDYKSKNYESAYENWIWCLDNAPKLSVNIYKLGATIAKHRLKNATEADKPAAIALVERVYDQRIKNYPQDLAKVYSDYATFMVENGYEEDKVYAALQKSYEADPSKMGIKSMFRFFKMLTERNKDENVQFIFDTYDVLVKGVESKLNYYAAKLDKYHKKEDAGNVLSSKEQKMVKAYENNSKAMGQVVGGLDKIITDLSTCERLIPLYTKDFEANKTNSPWLKSAVNMMYKKECTDDPLYDKLVETYVNVDGSPEAYVFYAGMLMKNNEMNKAQEYFLKAVGQETDAFKKAKYLYKIASIMEKKGRKSEARKYALQAIKNQRSMGKAYLLIARMYASSANDCGASEFEKRMVYVAALDMARNAAAVDPVLRKKAEKYVTSYKASAPDKKAIFTEGVQSGSPYKIGCWIGVTVKIP